MRSLAIGASGQVGALLRQLTGGEERCVGTYCHHPIPGLIRLDLRNLESLRQIIHDVRPDVCYLPGALTFVDYAEAHPQECHEINVLAISHLARALAEINGLLCGKLYRIVISSSARVGSTARIRKKRISFGASKALWKNAKSSSFLPTSMANRLMALI